MEHGRAPARVVRLDPLDQIREAIEAMECGIVAELEQMRTELVHELRRMSERPVRRRRKR